VLGKYHPTATRDYEALAHGAGFLDALHAHRRQGNFGSVDATRPAYRYTECRSSASLGLLADIEKETVDFVATTRQGAGPSRSDQVPTCSSTVLGHRVGMATTSRRTIWRVVDACQALLRNPTRVSTS